MWQYTVFSLTLSLSLSLSPGHNNLSLFQPKSPDTQDLANNLLVYYHAKAVKGQVCFDLSLNKPRDKCLNGQFMGQHYIIWNVKVYDLMTYLPCMHVQGVKLLLVLSICRQSSAVNRLLSVQGTFKSPSCVQYEFLFVTTENWIVVIY